MKILGGVLIENDEGKILCATRNVPGKRFYGYLSAPWGRAEEGEDPKETAEREGGEELAGQRFVASDVCGCAATGDGYRLYLFKAKPCAEGIDLGRHSEELADPCWLSAPEILAREKVVPTFASILRVLY